MKNLFFRVLLILLALTGTALAQPGPSSGPFVQNNQQINPKDPTSCLVFPSTAAGGCKGNGTANFSDVYVGGSPIQGSGLPYTQLWIGNLSGIATPQQMSGDCTLAADGVITCAGVSGIVAGTTTITSGYNNGLAYQDASGKFNVTTSLANAVPVTDGSSVLSLSTTLPDGLAMGTPASLTLTNAIGLPNGGLLNSSVTVNGSTVALGGSTTITAAASSITSGTTTATGFTNGHVVGVSGGKTTDFGVSGSGTTVALTTSPVFTTPTLGAATGTSLALGSFAPVLTSGNQSGTSPWIGWAFERSAGQLSSAMAGIWSGSNTEALFGISELASSSNDPTGAVAGYPRFAFVTDVSTTTSVLQSIALGAINIGNANGANVGGLNVVIGQNSGITGGATVGIEVDMQGSGSSAYSSGVEVQAFDRTFDYGQRLIVANNGKFDIGYHFADGNYVTAAADFGNDDGTNKQRVLFRGTSGADASIRNTSSNVFTVVPGSAGGALRNQADSSTILGWTDSLVTTSTSVTMGNSTPSASGSPLNINMGGTLSNSDGSVTAAKLKIYDDSSTIYGIGVASGSFYYATNNGSAAHKFYLGATVGLSVSASAATFNGTVGATDITGTGTLRANTGFSANGSAGLSVTKTVRASGGASDCTLIYTFGLLTGGSC